MQIILLEKVVNVGDLGDVVKVKHGYARNFLIPQGKAKRATPKDANAEFEVQARRARKGRRREAGSAQEQGDKLEGSTVQITQKAGVDGRLFGSVTNVDIVDALKKQGFAEVEKAHGAHAGRPAEAGRRVLRCTSRCTPTSWSTSRCRVLGEHA